MFSSWYIEDFQGELISFVKHLFIFSFKSKPSFLVFENTSSMSLSRGQPFWLCISFSLENLMITMPSLSSSALDLQDEIFEVWPRRRSVGRYESSIIFIIWVDTIRWGIEMLSDLSKSHRWTVSKGRGLAESPPPSLGLIPYSQVAVTDWAKSWIGWGYPQQRGKCGLSPWSTHWCGVHDFKTLFLY